MILRGTNRQTIFEDVEDAAMFLQTLEKYQEKSKFKLFAYCLMGNHVHLLVKRRKRRFRHYYEAYRCELCLLVQPEIH